jgi:hypothetical protein
MLVKKGACGCLLSDRENLLAVVLAADLADGMRQLRGLAVLAGAEVGGLGLPVGTAVTLLGA